MNLLFMSGDRNVAAGRGGPFAWVLEAFSARWTRIDVLCPWSEGAAPRVLFGNVHVEPVRTGRLLAARVLTAQAREFLGPRRPDLVVSHAYGLCAASRAGARLAFDFAAPHVLEIHGVPGVPRIASARQLAAKLILAALLRRLRARLTAVRVVNPTELRSFVRKAGVPDGRILYMPAIYLDRSAYFPDEGPEARPAEYDVAWAARLVPGKGLLAFLDALALVKSSWPDIRVALVGEGPLGVAARLRAQVLGLDRNVRFLGWIARARDLGDVYRASRVFVLASDSEGGPRAPLEAMACGLPPIVTPVGLLPSVVRHGENGLFTTGRPADLAAKIGRLLAGEPETRRMGERATAAVGGFDRERAIGDYAQALSQIAAAGVARA